MELSDLTDDVLIKVFSYLSASELLQCRTVCRRWRPLALLPCLWRNKTIRFFDGKSREDLPAVLRVAPRLNELRLYGISDETIVEWGLLLFSTSCAVADLSISFDGADSGFASMVLARQVSLGRLKGVSLRLNWKNPSKIRLGALLRQLVCTEGLESICVEAWDHPELSHFPSATQVGGAVPPASLRILKHYVPCRDEYLPLYLEWHAATLEKVSFMADSPGARVASLLSSLPRLRDLRCPLLEDMHSLLPCPSLKRLFLHVDLTDSNWLTLPGVRAFLSSAVLLLEELVLDVFKNSDDDDAVSLVQSLGGTGTSPATLRSLKFCVAHEYEIPQVEWDPPLLLQPLASILHRLPHLRHLDIGGAPSDEFLEALDGRVLPNLRELEVCTSREFTHEQFHSERVRMLMRRNPRLHLMVTVASNEEGEKEIIECSHCPFPLTGKKNLNSLCSVTPWERAM
ncbi:uncharacterized protein LOC117646397 [Thrips palmi]|uniref:Uncharacterized protein LOC117646397 n=1 Tax=Thrips palmi TaxID=161013 RepID=A0A6P8YT19_THRPL|nr:uncharacterized protein LOC117646397 [Thrips palmi]